MFLFAIYVPTDNPGTYQHLCIVITTFKCVAPEQRTEVVNTSVIYQPCSTVILSPQKNSEDMIGFKSQRHWNDYTCFHFNSYTKNHQMTRDWISFLWLFHHTGSLFVLGSIVFVYHFYSPMYSLFQRVLYFNHCVLRERTQNWNTYWRTVSCHWKGFLLDSILLCVCVCSDALCFAVSQTVLVHNKTWKYISFCFHSCPCLMGH